MRAIADTAIGTMAVDIMHAMPKNIFTLESVELVTRAGYRYSPNARFADTPAGL